MAFGFIGVSLAALFLGNTITVVGVRLGFVDRHTTAREKVELNFNSNERRQQAYALLESVAVKRGHCVPALPASYPAAASLRSLSAFLTLPSSPPPFSLDGLTTQSRPQCCLVYLQ